VELSESLHVLHNRYLLQAKWTAENRRRLYDAANLKAASRVLEVGSGTGAISHELTKLNSIAAYGVDIDPGVVSFAQSIDSKTRYIIGDGIKLPYPNASFDVTLSHFLLMWINDPVAILEEMKRVTKAQGAVLALAEPDYGGRIDFPKELEALGREQAEALERQGAEPRMGRKLRMLFAEAGFKNIHIGVLGGEWYGIPDEMTQSSEWNMLTRDLSGRISKEKLDEYHWLDQAAWSKGHRLLYVPTFYASGWVPR